MAVVNFSEWKQFIASQPNPHILQTAEWGELKRAFGWDVERLVIGDWGIQILFRKLPLGFTVAYAPKPINSNQLLVSSAEFGAEIDKVCRQKRAVFLKIEPDCWDSDHCSLITDHSSLRTSPHNIQPPRTVVVSLEGSDDEILARMKQKCRYNVRLAEKKDVTVRSWDDLDGFHRLMEVTGGRDGFGVHSREYYQKAYELFHPAGIG